MSATKLSHAQFWQAVHAGQFHTAQFVTPTHKLRDFERIERENAYYAASRNAPTKVGKTPSKRTAKHANSGFHRGMYWDVNRACARDGRNHRESGNGALLRAQQALGI